MTQLWEVRLMFLRSGKQILELKGNVETDDGEALNRMILDIEMTLNWNPAIRCHTSTELLAEKSEKL